MTALLVALGGGLGAVLRWQLSTRARTKGATPAGGTLLVNVLGSFLLGDLQRLRATPINLCGNRTQSLVAPLTHTFKDGAHTAFNDTILIGGTLRKQRPLRKGRADIGL